MNKNPEMQGDTTTEKATHPAGTVEAKEETVELGPNDNLVMAEATIETKMPDGSVVETTVVPKKKKHTGLIIFIVVLILTLLGAGGVAAWYFLCHNNPENVAYSAINGLLQSKDVTVSGAFSSIIENEEGNDLKLLATFEPDQNGATGETKLTVMLSQLDANGNVIGAEPYRFEVGSVIMSDGVFYIRVDELAEIFDKLIAEGNLSEDDIYGITDAVAKILDTVDGEWWQISVPDLVDLTIEDNTDAQAAKNFYTCLVNVAHQDIKGELAKIYSNNRFVNVTKPESAASLAYAEGNTLYNVSFDYDKMANFVNALPSSETAQSIYNCYNRYLDSTGDTNAKRLSADSMGTVTADDLRETIPEDADINVQITNWEHKLSQVDIRSNDGSEALLSLVFEYKGIEVKAPENYRPISELFEELVQVVAGILDSIQSGTGGGVTYDPETEMIYDPITNAWYDIEDYLAMYQTT